MSFDPVIGGLIGAGLEFGGGMMTNNANAQNAQAMIDFQRQVLKKQIQWRVEDMKKAGINPLLAVGFGGGSASGAMAHMENPARGMASALATTAQAKAELELTRATADKVGAEAKIAEATAGVVDIEKDNSARKAKITNDLLKQKWYQGLQQSGEIMKSLFGWIGGARSVLDNKKGVIP